MNLFSQTWLVPFIYVAVMLALYLFAPRARRATVQQRMRTDPNFYLVANISLIPLAIWATLDPRQRWIDYLSWALLLVLVIVSIQRALQAPVSTEAEEPPPL
ncbi:MAG: hypothetical protein ACR2IE_13895 [Candidatus Sumerlaeaceae bacterium]